MKITITDIKGNKTSEIPSLDTDTYILALDGSTRRSGICVMSVGGRMGFVCAAERGGESVVEYKLALKKFLDSVLRRFDIKHAAYEEPFIGYAGDVKGLYMIATILEEIAAESLAPLTVLGVNNKRWKKQFLGRKLEGGRELQKKQVFEKAVSIAPGLSSCKDDETDAFGLAFYLAQSVRDDAVSAMSSQGKPRKFAYNLTLCGGRISSEEAVKIAGKPYKDGVIITDIAQKRSFDAAVYALMQGKNAVLVLYFKSGRFGDIILEHEAGELAEKHEVLSAVVTRKSSLRSKN